MNALLLCWLVCSTPFAAHVFQPVLYPCSGGLSTRQLHAHTHTLSLSISLTPSLLLSSIVFTLVASLPLVRFSLSGTLYPPMSWTHCLRFYAANNSLPPREYWPDDRNPILSHSRRHITLPHRPNCANPGESPAGVTRGRDDVSFACIVFISKLHRPWQLLFFVCYRKNGFSFSWLVHN